MGIDRTLLALEDAGWSALSTGRGEEFYQSVMLEEGLMVFPAGVFDKAQALAGIASAPPWESYELRHTRVLWSAENTASLVYEVEARRPNQPAYRALMTSTYVHFAGAWRLALHTQTPMGN